METTTIEVSIDNWRWLQAQKQRPSETFNDVLDRLREQRGDSNTEPEESNEAINEIEPADVPDDLDIPGSGETFERRRETIGTLVAYLKQEGTATRADFLELVDPDDVGYSSADSFWSNSIKGRDTLSAIEGVVPPSEGGHTWRFEP
jgi:predicted CopG family antitoxin